MKYNELIGIDLTSCKIIHHSKNEKIFLTQDEKIIKFSKNEHECRREYLILKYAQSSKYFPKVYEYRKGYIIREHISGICLIDYIKKNGLDTSLALSLVDLIEEFKILKFIKIDTGLSHIFIDKNNCLKVIGLINNCFKTENYPKRLFSGLKKLKVSKKFLRIIKKEKPELYDFWHSKK